MEAFDDLDARLMPHQYTYKAFNFPNIPDVFIISIRPELKPREDSELGLAPRAFRDDRDDDLDPDPILPCPRSSKRPKLRIRVSQGGYRRRQPFTRQARNADEHDLRSVFADHRALYAPRVRLHLTAGGVACHT